MLHPELDILSLRTHPHVVPKPDAVIYPLNAKGDLKTADKFNFQILYV